jgi:hypothetical protein
LQPVGVWHSGLEQVIIFARPRVHFDMVLQNTSGCGASAARFSTVRDFSKAVVAIRARAEAPFGPWHSIFGLQAEAEGVLRRDDTLSRHQN